MGWVSYYLRIGRQSRPDKLLTKMKTDNPATELNSLIAHAFGKGTKGMIARAPAWGHSDNCWIITGERAREAGSILAKKFGAKINVRADEFLGEVATIEWA